MLHIQSTPISLLAFVSTAVALLLGGALVARSCLRAAVRRHGTRILHAGTTPAPLAHVDVLKAGFATRKLPVGIDVIVILNSDQQDIFELILSTQETLDRSSCHERETTILRADMYLCSSAKRELSIHRNQVHIRASIFLQYE